MLRVLFIPCEGLTPSCILTYPGQIHEKKMYKQLNPRNIKIHESVCVMMAIDTSQAIAVILHPAQIKCDKIAGKILI